MNQPDTVQLIDYLKDLVQWEQFAIHLPGITQPDIDTIKRDESSTAGQKQALFDQWLRLCPKASWVNVVQALEKTGEMRIVSKLRNEFSHHSHVVPMSPSLSPAPKQQEIEEIQVKKHVVQRLNDLHKSFVVLTKDIKNEVEMKVENRIMTVKLLVQYTEEQKAFRVRNLHSVETSNAFFQAILPYYNFLNYDLILSLTMLLSGPIVQKANEYEDQVDRFKRTTAVKVLHKALDRYYKPFSSSATNIKVRIKLEKVWGEQKIWMVEELVKALLALKHPDECQWFEVKPGSIIITFLAPKHLMMLYIVNSVKKLQFMRLVGVITLQVGRIYSMGRMENRQFSFEDSLIEATLENNIEAVKFLLESIGVNVNVQRNLPTISFAKAQYKTETKVGFELMQFDALFESLIRDAEYELQTAMVTTQINIEKLSKNIEPSDSIKAADIISAVKASNNFLDYQIISNLKPFLSNSLSQRITQYSTRIENFKKSTKISLLHKQLKLFFKMEPPNATKTTLLLESTWGSCSMTHVEQLLQLIFSPSYLSVFKWFRVTTGSVGVVFLIPAHLQSNLIAIANSLQKLQLMKLTGIISLQVGETKIFQTSKAYNYSFAKEIAEAKQLGNSEALQLLLQVNESSIVNACILAMDGNKNYYHFPEPDSTPLMIACCNSNKELAKLFLDNNADPNIQTSRKFTALIYSSGSPEIFTLLLHHGADVNVVDIFANTILHWACLLGNIEILPLLLTLSPELLEKQTNNGETPLLIASSWGNMKIVKKLLQAHANPNIPDIDGGTPLYIASQRCYTQMVQWLLWANADPNSPDDYGVTPLHIASTCGHLQVIKQLLKASANPNSTDIHGLTPLHVASTNGHLQVIKQLLKAKADPNSTDSYGFTPLHVASMNGHLQVTKQLLKANAYPNIQSKQGITPLYIAANRGHVEIIKHLLEIQTDKFLYTVYYKGNTPLHAASRNGHVQVVECLLQAKADPNSKDENEVTPLIAASQNGHVHVVECLLQAEADPNIPSLNKETPLMVASDRGYTQIVEHLLQARADPNSTHGYGLTPLHVASMNGHLQVVKCLLQAKADPESKYEGRITPLFVASFNGHIQVVECLLQAKANPNSENENGITPLLAASQNGHVQVVECLLQTEADPNIPSLNKATPLIIASDSGYTQIVEHLLQARADPNSKDESGITPLFAASCNGHIQIVECLLQAKADPNSKDENGITPLFAASLSGHVQVVECLLQAEADPNIPSLNKVTPLMVASDRGYTQIVEQLLQARADPNIQDKNKRTSLHLASYKGYLYIVKQLLQAQADPTVKANNGFTPLDAALYNNHPEVATLIRQAQNNYNSSCSTQ